MATTTITFTFLDATTLNTIITAYCDFYDYTRRQAVGETQAQFTKRMLISEMKDKVASYQAQTAVAAARQQAVTAANSISIA
jgi:hypothetical protein